MNSVLPTKFWANSQTLWSCVILKSYFLLSWADRTNYCGSNLQFEKCMEELRILPLCWCVRALLVTLGVCATIHKLVLQVVVIPTTHIFISHWKWKRELWCFPLKVWLFTTQTHYLHRAPRKRSPQECFILWGFSLMCFAWIGFRAC